MSDHRYSSFEYFYSMNEYGLLGSQKRCVGHGIFYFYFYLNCGPVLPMTLLLRGRRTFHRSTNRRRVRVFDQEPPVQTRGVGRDTPVFEDP